MARALTASGASKRTGQHVAIYSTLVRLEWSHVNCKMLLTSNIERADGAGKLEGIFLDRLYCVTDENAANVMGVPPFPRL
jgi:hypothetical protein